MANGVQFSTNRDIAPESRPPTLDEQRRFWDWHWQHWRERGAISDWVLRRGERVLQTFCSLALDHPKILDLGCGMGWFSQELSRYGQVTGIDLSEEAVAKAKASYPHITFLAGNALAAALPPASFDVVVSQEVLAHVEDQARYLQVAAEVLRPGGYLILTTSNRFVLDHLGDSVWDPWPREHIEKFLDRKGLQRQLLPHFRVLRTTTVHPMGNGGILRLINSYKLNAALSLLIPARYLEALKERAGLGYTLLVLAQKKSGSGSLSRHKGT